MPSANRVSMSFHCCPGKSEICCHHGHHVMSVQCLLHPHLLSNVIPSPKFRINSLDVFWGFFCFCFFQILAFLLPFFDFKLLNALKNRVIETQQLSRHCQKISYTLHNPYNPPFIFVICYYVVQMSWVIKCRRYFAFSAMRLWKVLVSVFCHIRFGYSQQIGHQQNSSHYSLHHITHFLICVTFGKSFNYFPTLLIKPPAMNWLHSRRRFYIEFRILIRGGAAIVCKGSHWPVRHNGIKPGKISATI